MREIKFRMYCDKWRGMIYSNFTFIKENREIYPFCFNIGFSHYPHEENNTVIMQYTGIKDKNGKEVYEGGVLHYYYDCIEGTQNYKSKVFFADGEFKAERISIHNFIESILTNGRSAFEVIGNIYENPKLLTDFTN